MMAAIFVVLVFGVIAISDVTKRLDRIAAALEARK